jgi:hypothetical protein
MIESVTWQGGSLNNDYEALPLPRFENDCDRGGDDWAQQVGCYE